MEILFFGQLTDITQSSAITLADDFADLEQLQQAIFLKFPALKNAKFAIALNNEIVLENVALPKNCRLAFMPPFSGG